MVVKAQSDLLEVIGALQATGGFADPLDGGQHEGNENGDDRDDDEQF